MKGVVKYSQENLLTKNTLRSTDNNEKKIERLQYLFIEIFRKNYEDNNDSTITYSKEHAMNNYAPDSLMPNAWESS